MSVAAIYFPEKLTLRTWIESGWLQSNAATGSSRSSRTL